MRPSQHFEEPYEEEKRTLETHVDRGKKGSDVDAVIVDRRIVKEARKGQGVDQGAGIAR